MSRVGKHAVTIPDSVSFSRSGNVLGFKSHKGDVQYTVHPLVSVSHIDNVLVLKPTTDKPWARAVWGTTRRNVANIVHGLDKGFVLSIKLVGVGYRASVSGRTLRLQLGYSHDIVYDMPEGIDIQCEDSTLLKVCGCSKQRVGEVGAFLSSLRPPEPYKGKGVVRENVYVVRKEGKKK